MADGVKPIGGTFEDIGEVMNDSVAKPMKDQLGEMVEQGKQSIAPKAVAAQQVSAADAQQKNLDQQQKITEARRRIFYWQDLEAKTRAIREEEKRKEAERKQKAEQEEQEKKKVKQFEIQKKAEVLNTSAKGKAEIKRGVGG